MDVKVDGSAGGGPLSGAERGNRTLLAEFTYRVERCKFREMAEAIGDANPVYTDSEAARAEGYADVIAPPTFGTCVGLWGGPGFPDICRRLGANPLRVLHAEHEYQYLEAIYPGDTLHASMYLADVYTKEGRSGTMKFFVVETTCRREGGEAVLISRATLLERM